MTPGQFITGCIKRFCLYVRDRLLGIFQQHYIMTVQDDSWSGIASYCFAILQGSLVGCINICAPAMKIINTFFILYPKKYKQATGHSQCKSGYVNSGVHFMPGNIPPGGL